MMKKHEIVVCCTYSEEKSSFWDLIEESFRLFLSRTIAEDDAVGVSCS